MTGHLGQLAEDAGHLAVPRAYLLFGRHHAADARRGSNDTPRKHAWK